MVPLSLRSLNEVLTHYQPQRAILFGSHARTDADEHSDIDLLLIKSTKKPFLERLKEFSLMLPKDFPRVDAFIYTPEEFAAMQERENPLVMRALQEGIIIYETPN
ncbi:MAG: nucleotidyltransferase domain-containing protein [Patescibacteria group bacterium]